MILLCRVFVHHIVNTESYRITEQLWKADRTIRHWQFYFSWEFGEKVKLLNLSQCALLSQKRIRDADFISSKVVKISTNVFGFL